MADRNGTGTPAAMARTCCWGGLICAAVAGAAAGGEATGATTVPTTFAERVPKSGEILGGWSWLAPPAHHAIGDHAIHLLENSTSPTWHVTPHAGRVPAQQAVDASAHAGGCCHQASGDVTESSPSARRFAKRRPATSVPPPATMAPVAHQFAKPARVEPMTADGHGEPASSAAPRENDVWQHGADDHDAADHADACCHGSAAGMPRLVVALNERLENFAIRRMRLPAGFAALNGFVTGWLATSFALLALVTLHSAGWRTRRPPARTRRHRHGDSPAANDPAAARPHGGQPSGEGATDPSPAEETQPAGDPPKHSAERLYTEILEQNQQLRHRADESDAASSPREEEAGQ